MNFFKPFYATKEHLKYILPSECKFSIYQLKPISLIIHNNIQVFKHLFHFLLDCDKHDCILFKCHQIFVKFTR